MSTLVHKYINLKEPEDIKKQVSTKFLKKEITGFTLNLKPQRRSEQKVFFKFSPLFVVLTFQTIHQQPRSRSMRGKLTWLNLWNKLWPFKQNYLVTVFTVIQCGFENFQTVLSLNWKIILLKTSNLLKKLSLISNKAPNLLSGICSEMKLFQIQI